MRRLLHRLAWRRCRSEECSLVHGYHTAHLSLYGRWRYAGWRPWNRARGAL